MPIWRTQWAETLAASGHFYYSVVFAELICILKRGFAPPRLPLCLLLDQTAERDKKLLSKLNQPVCTTLIYPQYLTTHISAIRIHERVCDMPFFYILLTFMVVEERKIQLDFVRIATN